MAHHCTFAFPMDLKDLAEQQAAGQYYVQEVIRPQSIKSKLQAVSDLIERNGKADFMFKSFDVFYSILSQFYKIDPKVREHGWEVLLNGSKKLVDHISTVVEDLSRIPHDTRVAHLNSLKMCVYLLCQFIEVFENLSVRETNEAMLISGKGRKKGTKSSTKNPTLDHEKDQTLQILNHIVQLPIQKLWDPPVIEEEFFQHITSMCYKLLENPANARDCDTRDMVLHVIAHAVRKHGHTLSFSLKIIQLLQNNEHLVSPLVKLTEIMVNECGAKNIVSEIIREICHLDINDLFLDNAATKALSQFIAELSEKLPSLVLSSISLLLTFLDQDAFLMRNCVLTAIGRIVLKLLSRDDLDAKSQDLRDELLDKLEEHLHDVNAHVRSRSLQTWHMLCSEKAVPLSRQHQVLQVVIGRLQDKSSIVRKNAVLLVTCFVKSNPFAAKLPLNKLKSLLEKETTKLKSMLSDEAARNNDAAEGNICATKQVAWEMMKTSLAEVIQDVLQAEDNNDEPETEIADLITDVFKEIRVALDDAHYVQAVKMAVAARQAFPDHPMLHPTMDEDPLKDAEIEDEDEDEDVLSSQQRAMMIALENIYLAPFRNAELVNVMEKDLLKDMEEVASALMTSEDNKEEDATNVQVISDVAKQQVLVHFLEDCVKFVEQVDLSFPLICDLLGSYLVTDVLTAVEFFVTVCAFGMSGAVAGMRHMLRLAWAEEASIRDAVMAAYKTLYLHGSSSSDRNRAVTIVANLTHLVKGMSLGEMASFEQVVINWVKNNELDGNVIQVLWERFSMKILSTTKEESHIALILIGMIASASPPIVSKNLDVLLSIGLGPRADEDFGFARTVCSVFLKLTTQKKASVESKEPPFRLPENHTLFTRLSEIIVQGIKSVEDKMYVPMAEEGIKVIYQLSECPDILCANIIKKLIQVVFGISAEGDCSLADAMSSCSSLLVSRFLSVVGHVALCQMYHLDLSIFMEVKRRQFLKDEQSAMSKKNDKQKGVSSAAHASKIKDMDASNNNTAVDEEFGLGGSNNEDAVAEFICKMLENEVVTGENLLSHFCALITSVASDPTRYQNPYLQAASASALAKYMMVSSSFCESQMPLLITLLEKSDQAVVRENIICFLGDLSMRFPNIVEPWTPYLYARIKDPCVSVRRNTLSILKHLILNDMIKVKGQISDVALCVVDPDADISRASKQLFRDLARKGNALYNLLPDIIGRLSDLETGTDEKNFRAIIKFILSFIEKERQVDSLIEKLCHRLRAARSERQWCDFAFCLSLFSYTEHGIRKLHENVACFADKLHCQFLNECLTIIINAAKKNAKQDTAKTVIEEFEKMLEQLRNRGCNENDTEMIVASQTPLKCKPKPGMGKTTSKKVAKVSKKSNRLRRKRYCSDTDDEDDFSTSVSSKTSGNVSVRHSTRIASQPSRKRPQPNFFESDEED